MSDQDVFDDTVDDKNNQPDDTNNTNPGSNPPPSSEDLFADKLKEIKNENGEPKYKTVEDALEALNHSQQFIEKLKTEKQELEDQWKQTQGELETRESVEDVVKRLTENNGQPSNREGDQPQENGLDEEKVQQLVTSVLSQREQETQANQNINTVQAALVEQYGDQAKTVIQQKATELGTTPGEIKELAKRNPKMALTILGGATPNSTQPSTSSVSPPRGPSNELEKPKFDKSLTRGGASNKELAEAFNKVKEYTNKRLGVEN